MVRRTYSDRLLQNGAVAREDLDLRGLRIAYAAFLLTAVGRVGELVPGLGSLPLAKVSMGIAAVLLIAKWKRLPKLPAVATPFFRTALALVALAVVTAPFSIWVGQTFHFLALQLPVIAAAIIMCCKISYTWEVLRGVMRILVVAAVALAVVAILAFHGGRADASVSYDPNDLAYVLVSSLPLALAFALIARTKAKILTNAAVCTVLLLALLLTSSRGGFFGTARDAGSPGPVTSQATAERGVLATADEAEKSHRAARSRTLCTPPRWCGRICLPRPAIGCPPFSS